MLVCHMCFFLLVSSLLVYFSQSQVGEMRMNVASLWCCGFEFFFSAVLMAAFIVTCDFSAAKKALVLEFSVHNNKNDIFVMHFRHFFVEP